MPSRRWSVLAVPVLTAVLALTACSSQPAATPPAPTQLYVDPATGLDTNPGTQAEPLKTIAEALKDYAAGETVVLDAGTYDEISGETWAYTLPAGIVLKANTSGVVLSSNSGANGFTTSGDATLNGLTLTGFHDAVTAPSGTLTVGNATFDSNYRGIVLSGTTKADLTTTTFQGTGAGVDLTASSSLTMTGGSVTGLTYTGFYADGAASVSLNQVTVTNTTYEVVELRASATATLTDCSIDNSSPQGGGSEASLVSSDSSTLALKNTSVGNAAAYGVLADGSGSLTIQGGDIYGNGTAGVYAMGSLSIDGTTVSYNGYYGVEASGTSTITNAFIDNNTQDGIYYDGTQNLTVKGTELKSNKIGVQLVGTGGGGTAYLGGAGDPGGNTLQSVSGGTGIYADAWDLTLIFAGGNTWTPNVQGADAAGAYPDGSVVGPASGANYSIGQNVSLYL